MKCTVSIAQLTVQFDLRIPETGSYFSQFSSEDPAVITGLSVTEDRLEKMRSLYAPGSSDAILEFSELAPVTCGALLAHDRCMFHGVAILWREKAWIFTAPPGTGKSTQYILWKLAYGGEVSILNGDKPALEFRSDGSVWVHPTPWAGKEGLNSAISAPLGGIVCLEQGPENGITKLTPAQAVVPVYHQILYLAETEQEIRKACALEERLLQAVPVWKLVNRGDEASARLTHDTILAEITGGSL